jgi:hypothetical protein
MYADGRGRASSPARERGAPEYAGPQEDETHTAWLPRTGHDAAQGRQGW